jgi:aspartokinase/homoserine dehydrogenase 1
MNEIPPVSRQGRLCGERNNMSGEEKMRVIKFGGTSIGTPEKFLNVAKIIAVKSEEEFSIVVLSAIGGITDKLLETITLASNGSKQYQKIFEQIKSFHFDFLSKVAGSNYQEEIHLRLTELLNQLEDKLRGVFLLNECSDRISDSIVTYGEYFSNILMVGVLKSRGKECEFYDARKLIRTNSSFGDAEVNFTTTNHLLREWYNDLRKDHIPIFNGFIGSDKNGHITTLGRSGSDFTATIIGGALKARVVEIWTDVDGVLSADPKIVSSASTLDELSYDEAASLAVLGGKVLHPKTISPVEKQNVPVIILNTFSPQTNGTFIGSGNNHNAAGIKTVTYLNGLSSISIFEAESRYGQKVLARLFGLIARLEIPIVTISKSAYNQSISFIVQNEFEHSFLDEIKREFVLEIEKGLIGEITSRNNLSLISAIGVNNNFTSLVTRKIYDVLETNEIKSLMFLNDPGSLNISFLIDAKDVKKTVIVLHNEFFEKTPVVNVA